MTDQQLVFEFRRAAIREERSVCTSEDADNISGVQMLIHALADGKCNGIKNGIACRVAQFAADPPPSPLFSPPPAILARRNGILPVHNILSPCNIHKPMPG